MIFLTLVDGEIVGVEDPIENGPPVGSIIAFHGGYYGDDSNGSGYTDVLGNSVSAVNTLLNSSGWYVCNGAECNISGSPIFNGSGRHLPNLTDDRFIMGLVSASNTGGSSAMDHNHSIAHDHASFTSGATTLTQAQTPAHVHLVGVAVPVLVTTGGTWNAYPDHHSLADTNRNTSSVGSSGSHTHSVDPPSFSGTSGVASVTENRPKYLSCIYIIKVL